MAVCNYDSTNRIEITRKEQSEILMAVGFIGRIPLILKTNATKKHFFTFYVN